MVDWADCETWSEKPEECFVHRAPWLVDRIGEECEGRKHAVLVVHRACLRIEDLERRLRDVCSVCSCALAPEPAPLCDSCVHLDDEGKEERARASGGTWTFDRDA